MFNRLLEKIGLHRVCYAVALLFLAATIYSALAVVAPQNTTINLTNARPYKDGIIRLHDPQALLDPANNLAPLSALDGLITYVGAIRIPNGDYSDGTIAINRRNPNRLFVSGGGAEGWGTDYDGNGNAIRGNSQRLFVKEVDISGVVNTKDFAQVPTATTVQDFTDIWQKLSDLPGGGNTDEYNPISQQDTPVLASMFYETGATAAEDVLYASFYKFYDGSADTAAVTTAITNPANLSTASYSPLRDAYYDNDGTPKPAQTSLAKGVAEMPAAWQTALGGKHLFFTDSNLSIITRSAFGMRISVGDIAQAKTGDITVTTKVFHDQSNRIWCEPQYVVTINGTTLNPDGCDSTNFSGENKTHLFTTGFHGDPLFIGDYVYFIGSSGGHYSAASNPYRYLTQAQFEALPANSPRKQLDIGSTPGAFSPPIIGAIDYKIPDTLGRNPGGPITWNAQDNYTWVCRYRRQSIQNAIALHAVKPDQCGRFPSEWERYDGVEGYPDTTRPYDGFKGTTVDTVNRRIYVANPWLAGGSTGRFNAEIVLEVYSY